MVEHAGTRDDPSQCHNFAHADYGLHKHDPNDELGWMIHNPPDMVNHPPHYGHHPSGVECIEIVEWYNFNVGNAIKYLWRHDRKGASLQDLQKARWYIDREIDRQERVGNATTPDLPHS